MWKLLGAILILHFNDLLHGKLVGDHVCLTEESYLSNDTEYRIRNATVRNYQWCMNMPPRCSFYTTKLINETRIVEKNLTRTVEKCCAGFLEEDDKCVSVCKGCKNGLCQEGTCLCSAGYTGQSCEVACDTGRWGRNCSFECSCADKKCDPKDGLCMPETSSTISYIETSEIVSSNRSKYPTTPVFRAETNHTSTIASTRVSVAESSTTHTTPAIVTLKTVSETTISSTKVNVDESSTTHTTPAIVRLESVSATTRSPEATTHAHSTSAITTHREPTAHTRTTIAITSPTASFKETGILTDLPSPTTSFATTARGTLINNVTSSKVLKNEYVTTSSIDKNINDTSTPKPHNTVTTNTEILDISTNSLKTSTDFLSTISSISHILINNVTSDKTKKTGMVNLSSTNSHTNTTNTRLKTKIIATMKEQINKDRLNITYNHTLANATETAKNIQNSLDDYKEYLIPVEVHYDQITRPIIKKDALTTTPNNFADEKSFLTVYDKEYINKHISEEKNKVVINFSIAGTTILVIVVIVVSLLGIALLWRSRNKKKLLKDNNEICPPVAIYTTSIFHTPLPDPPTFENLTYLTPTDLGVKLNEQISFKSHIATPKSVELAAIKVKDYREYVYDHPPSTGSYRAASSIEPIDSNLNHRLAEIEPVYDEIPQRCQDVAETSFCYECQSEQPTSLYVNTCGRTKF